MENLYLRAPGAETQDGPFSLEQIRELAGSELVQPETLYCSEENGEYEPISENQNLCQQIFAAPEKESSGLKLKKTLSEPQEDGEAKQQNEAEEAPAMPPADEFEVSSPGADSWDGPFSTSQLRDLAESGVITAASLIRTSGSSESIVLSEKTDLWERIKPEQKVALKLKKSVEEKEPVSAEEKPGTKKKKEKTDGKIPPVSPYDESGNIEQMLAAAEGKTEQTKHVQRLKKSRARAVSLLLPTIAFSLLIFIAVMVEPCWREIYEMFRSGEYSFTILKENWFLLFAIADLILMIGIGLGQTGLFSLLRIRCGIGIGVFFFLFYSRQEWLAAGAFSLLQAGLIGATLSVRLYTTLIFSILSLGGGAAMIWLVWFKGIAF